MQTEKIAVIALAIIVAGAISGFLLFENGDDILDNLFPEEPKEEPTYSDLTIEYGDCVDLHYIERYASNNSIISSTYDNPESKSGGEPVKIYVTKNLSEMPPANYSDYAPFEISGLVDRIVGLNGGTSETIGPVPPEEAYGVEPKIGDIINVDDPTYQEEVNLEFIDIIPNSPLPAEFQGMGLEDPTTIYVVKDLTMYLGKTFTIYPAWENLSVITKMNDTTLWLDTTPPVDEMDDFTWKEYDAAGNALDYFVNASSVTTLNDTTIIVTHTPEVGDTTSLPDPTGYYGNVVYTVEEVTDDSINVSYTDITTGNTTYTTFSRTYTIERNQTQEYVFNWPPEMVDVLVYWLQQIDPSISYSFSDLADESIIYDVVIVKVIKTSQLSS